MLTAFLNLLQIQGLKNNLFIFLIMTKKYFQLLNLHNLEIKKKKKKLLIYCRSYPESGMAAELHDKSLW